MKHMALPRFWDAYNKLPKAIQELADKNFQLLKADSNHPSVRLKKIGPLWSARVGRQYRALGRDEPEGILWFWIGTHAEYDRHLKGK